MKLYLYMPDDKPETVASGAAYFTAVSKMYSTGFLPPDATVWASSTDHSLSMWVLAEESTHVRVYDTINAGWARITRSSVRFGPSLDSTTRDPLKTFTLDGVPCVTDDHPSSTILVYHAQPDKRVEYVANSKIVRGVRDGRLRFDPFTVVDMRNYKAPKAATTDPVQHAHAVLNGVAVMTQGTDPDVAQFVRENMEAFAVPLDERALGFTESAYTAMVKYSTQWARQMQVNMKAAGGMPPAAVGAGSQ